MGAPQAAPSPWNLIAGSLKQVAGARNNVAAGVNSNDNVYRWNGSAWAQCGSNTMTFAIPDDLGNVWAVTNGQIWVYTAAGQWAQEYTGSYQAVALDSAGNLYGSNGTAITNLTQRNQLGQTARGTVTSFDVGPVNHAVRVVGGELQSFAPGQTDFVTMPLPPGKTAGTATIGDDGVILMTATSGQIYRSLGNGNWQTVPGGLMGINARDAANCWGVNSRDQIYQMRIDATVPATVSFGVNTCLTITPDEIGVPYGKNYKIQWNVDVGAHQNVNITAVEFTGNPPFADLHGNFGTSCFVVDEDANPGRQRREFAYTLRLTADGVNYATDPKIVNEPDDPTPP